MRVANFFKLFEWKDLQVLIFSHIYWCESNKQTFTCHFLISLLPTFFLEFFLQTPRPKINFRGYQFLRNAGLAWCCGINFCEDLFVHNFPVKIFQMIDINSFFWNWSVEIEIYTNQVTKIYKEKTVRISHIKDKCFY